MVSPADFGLPSHPLDSVHGKTPAENAVTLKTLLNNQMPLNSPIETFVMLNAAALLLVSGVATDLKDGVRRARESISSGKAKAVLENLVNISQTELRRIEEPEAPAEERSSPFVDKLKSTSI